MPVIASPPRHRRARDPRRIPAARALVAVAFTAGSARAQSPVISRDACISPGAVAAAPATAALPLRLFAYDRTAPLDLRDSVQRVDGSVTVHRISFASPKGGRATGLLLVPHDSLRGASRRFAGLVLLHGAPGNAEGMLGVARPIASHGAVVLALDAPFARRDYRDPLSITPRDSVEQVQLMVDLQRAVDVLAARADVDPARMGFAGASYGGAMGGLFAGVERRIRAYALLVADAGIAAHFTNADGSRMAPPGPVPAARWCRWLDAMDGIGGTRFISRAAPAQLLFLWGTRDELVKPYLAEALWRAAPEPKEARWYDSGHGLPPAAHMDMIDWLAARIGLTPVSAAERGAFPKAAPIRVDAAAAWPRTGSEPPSTATGTP